MHTPHWCHARALVFGMISTRADALIRAQLSILDPADELGQPRLRFIHTLVGISVDVAHSTAITLVFKRRDHRT
jgi:hypothetical protein